MTLAEKAKASYSKANPDYDVIAFMKEQGFSITDGSGNLTFLEGHIYIYKNNMGMWQMDWENASGGSYETEPLPRTEEELIAKCEAIIDGEDSCSSCG